MAVPLACWLACLLARLLARSLARWLAAAGWLAGWLADWEAKCTLIDRSEVCECARARLCVCLLVGVADD